MDLYMVTFLLYKSVDNFAFKSKYSFVNNQSIYIFYHSQ